MERVINEGLLSYFRELDDPRVKGRTKHLLIDIIAISVCAIICDCRTFLEIQEWALQREQFLRKILQLPNGIPSHDTIWRTLSILNQTSLEDAFRAWVKDIQGEEIRRASLDGKAVKGTERSFNTGKRPLMLVSVFAHETGLVLAQSKSPGSGNAELKGALDCIENLDLKKTLISVDAGLGHKTLLNAVCDKGGDYIVPIKANARSRHTELERVVEEGIKMGVAKFAITLEEEHARKDQRECWLMSSKALSENFRASYPNVKTIMKIRRVRDVKDKRTLIQKTGRDGKQYYEKGKGGRKVTEQIVYYISSRKLSPGQALREARAHWGIENKLHWRLDVIFGEDDSTIRNKVCAQNFAVMRKISFNLLQQNPAKESFKLKMKRASWNPDYLYSLLLGEF